MKLKEGYLLREVAGEYVVFPTGQNVVDSGSMVSVNETGKEIMEKLKDDILYEDLKAWFWKKYEAENEEEEVKLREDLDYFLNRLYHHDMLVL